VGPFLLSLVVGVIGVPAAAQQAAQSDGSTDSAATPSSPNPPGLHKLLRPPGAITGVPVVLDLSVDGNRTVGGGIVATFAVMARKSLGSVQIELVLPEGIHKTAGEPTWQGPMAAGEVRIVEVSAELSAPGVKKIVGRVTMPSDAAGGAPHVLTAEREWEVGKGKSKE
jgi:hypothetical protein